MKFKHVPTGHPSGPFEAFRQLVYAHGAPELARLMGLKPGTLYNKADADEETHHQPTLRDVVLATRLTGDMRVLDALDEEFGRASFDVTPLTHVSDEALLELFLTLGKEIGEFHAVARSALMDRNFNQESLGVIRAEAFDAVSALMTLVKRLEGLLDE